ncbi:hypothetical protein MSG28_007473 [Choristoneura fumiferana]|uniref:Uncharacterized protein n=1 Tax=Choristoneura fumiferana TaxID=7141 RepID=A0ACC0JX47_CHOFU|nr:hypothetical protein MSG28_007473 [Choristoneura fumiferana]
MSCRNNGVQEEELQDSSEEENPILPEIRVLSRLSGLPARPRPSVANAPGTSGNTPPAPPAPPPSSVASPARRQNRLDRDRFFWTLMGNSSRTNPRCRNSAGPSRAARPSSVADLIASNNRLFQPARCPPYAVNNDTPSTSGTRPTKSLRQVVKEITREHMRMITVERKVPSDESIRESIEYALRHSIQEHEARNANRNANASGGRQLMLVRTARPERSDAPNGTNTSQLSEEDMEVRVGSPSTTDDYVETVIEVAEPINMTTGAISLEEEIVEIDTEPEAPAPAPANPTPAPEEIPGSSTSEPSEQSRAAKRKREGDTHESVSSLNQCLLGLLECPVCMEWMEPPITQCRRGHLVCGTCRKRLDTCPVCRTAFSSVRNRAMENVAGILRYPCRHGCGKEVRHARRARTRRRARRAATRAAAACEAAPPMPRAALPAHCQYKSRHPQQYRSGCSQRVSLRVNCEQHQHWVVAALTQLFHVRVHVDVRTWGVVVYVALLGPQKLAKNYTYEVRVSGRHNNRGLVYKRTTHSDLENSVLNTSRQDCFHLTLDQALNFLRYKNEHSETDKTLDFTINLAECEEPEESREISDCGSPKE